MTKPIAFLIHLLISLAVVSIVYLVIRFQIYPDFYFKIQGISEIILLLFLVDVVLGPLLTFIVFKPGKKSLKFDLSVIALFQIAALFYGAHTIYQERPLSALLVNNSFEIQTASSYDLTAVDPSIIDTSWISTPRFHVFQGTQEIHIDLMVQAFTGEGEANHLVKTEYYFDLKDQKQRIELGNLEKDKLERFYPDLTLEFDRYFYIRVIGKSGFAVALVDKETFVVERVVEVTDFDMNPL